MIWCFVCMYKGAVFTWSEFLDWEYQYKTFLFDKIVIFSVFDASFA